MRFVSVDMAVDNGKMYTGADLEKYSWGGKRGTGDFEGWHPMAEVYTVCRFN